MEQKILVAGSGGQGILFLGKLIAYTAMLIGKEVTWFPSYGAEIRGGSANCIITISNKMIGSPISKTMDIMLILNETSYKKFAQRLSSDRILIYDSSLIKTTDNKDFKTFALPAMEIAGQYKSRASNMAIAGAFTSASTIFNLKDILSGLDKITPIHKKDFLKTNKNIIIKSYEFIENKKI